MSYVYERKTELPPVEWAAFVGNGPRDLGFVNLLPEEMMFWMYCPISTPDTGRGFILPQNLQVFSPLVRKALASDEQAFRRGYVYITAKTLYVSNGYIGNRPGWHCDGFGTDDLNFIWADRAPTEFMLGAYRVSADCDQSMQQMEQIGNMAASLGTVTTYPDKHLLRLDRTVMHRSPVNFTPGMRTFVKVSISEHRYDLIGNSINHELGALDGPLQPRREGRNHPASVQ
jgi:hypothetical protein